ncbi:MAG: homoserine O-acetyltransferase, partial [Bacteroidota bacterium]
MKHHELEISGSFQVESGESLPGIKISYSTSGTYEPSKRRVIWVCHALTGNADVEGWWPGLFGADKCYDPSECFYVCANVIGSCYGSTGPIHVPESHRFYNFPKVTI